MRKADISRETAQEVDRALDNYFELAHKWGCVLLLDEADVFLSERTKGNLKENSLVSSKLFPRSVSSFSVRHQVD